MANPSPLQVIDFLNRDFNSFWDSYNKIPLYFNENDLKLESQDEKQLALVYPTLSGSERTSLGDSYNRRTTILFSVRLYTLRTIGNIPHQTVTNKILEFFSTKRTSGAKPLTPPVIVGPVLIPDFPPYITSSISATFAVDNDVLVV